MPYSPAQIMLLAIWNGYLENRVYKLATFCLKTWTLWNWNGCFPRVECSASRVIWYLELLSHSIWQRLSGTIGTVTTISSSGVRPPGDVYAFVFVFLYFSFVYVCICVLRSAPERRVPHPDTLQLPVDSCIIVGIGTGCFFIFGHIFYISWIIVGIGTGCWLRRSLGWDGNFFGNIIGTNVHPIWFQFA